MGHVPVWVRKNHHKVKKFADGGEVDGGDVRLTREEMIRDRADKVADKAIEKAANEGKSGSEARKEASEARSRFMSRFGGGGGSGGGYLDQDSPKGLGKKTPRN